MNSQELNISVIDPIGPAFEKVKEILFRPFDLGKWFVIGFCAWLAYLGSGGGNGGGGNINFPRGGHSGAGPDQVFHEAKNYISANLAWIIPVVLIVITLVITIWLVITWLNSRGRFMFLHCVALNKAEVKVPWRKFQKHGDSLFLFRIVLALIYLATLILPIGIAILVIVTLVRSDARIGFVLGLIAVGLVVFVISIAFAIVKKFVLDFVVPIMFLRTSSSKAAWRQFLELLSANKGRFALYILFQIVIGMALGTIVLAAVCATLCCLACFLGIPYIGTVLMLPVLVFKLAYSLCYIRQFGPEFDVFSTEETALA